MNDDELLASRYAEIAASGDHTSTASDVQLRELEIEYARGFIREGDRVLDVGCGMGYAAIEYAQIPGTRVAGLDYIRGMIDQANSTLVDLPEDLGQRLEFIHGSVLELPFNAGSLDVVTSHRCLMALLTWERQREALREIHRVLRPGGVLVLLEGTVEGLDRLNELRMAVGLSAIPADGRDRLLTRKFHEEELLAFTDSLFTLTHRRGFGTYYFVGRVVHPLLVAPEPPRYDHPINAIARALEQHLPNLVDCGHLQAFVLAKGVE